MLRVRFYFICLYSDVKMYRVKLEYRVQAFRKDTILFIINKMFISDRDPGIKSHEALIPELLNI